MTPEKFKETYSDSDLDMVKDFLMDLADVTEQVEPHAVNTIRSFKEAVESLPMTIDECVNA